MADSVIPPPPDADPSKESTPVARPSAPAGDFREGLRAGLKRFPSTTEITESLLARGRAATGRAIERGANLVLSGPDRPPRYSIAANLAGQVLNPVPGSTLDAGLMAIDPVIAMSPMGVFRKGLTTGTLHAGREALDPSDKSNKYSIPISGALGFASGLLGGGARNLATGGEANRRLTETWRAIMRHAGSNEVRAVVRPLRKHVFGFTSEKTLRAMRRAASDHIEKEWTQIANDLPITHLVPLRTVPPAQRSTVWRHVQGQEGVAGPTGQALGLDTSIPPLLSAEQALRARNRLKASGNDLWHDVERDILASLPDALQTKYHGSLVAYFKDQRAIDHVSHLQDVRQLPSGINPTDFPGYRAAGAEDAGAGSLGRGAYHLAMGLTHPTSPWGAVHLGEAAREAATTAARRGGAVAGYTPPSARRRILGNVGAIGASELGATSQAAMDAQ